MEAMLEVYNQKNQTTLRLKRPNDFQTNTSSNGAMGEKYIKQSEIPKILKNLEEYENQLKLEQNNKNRYD